MKVRKITFRFHALRKMFERKITEREVLDVLENGKNIEEYPTDRPYPSRLILGFVESRPIHVVAADILDSQEIIIVTVYRPDLNSWESEFEKRRRK